MNTNIEKLELEVRRARVLHGNITADRLQVILDLFKKEAKFKRIALGVLGVNNES